MGYVLSCSNMLADDDSERNIWQEEQLVRKGKPLGTPTRIQFTADIAPRQVRKHLRFISQALPEIKSYRKESTHNLPSPWNSEVAF